MGSDGGRRYHGGSRSRRKAWIVFCLFGTLLGVWMAVMMLVVPGELVDIGRSLGNENEEGVSESATLQKDLASPRAGRQYEAPTIAVGFTLDGIIGRMKSFLEEVHERFRVMENPNPMGAWTAYKEMVDKWLLPIDRASKGQTLFAVRDDYSIFVSVASYRDDNCPKTLTEMYSKAAHPERLFVGLVQQNCVSDCRSGVLEGAKVVGVPPDVDCYKEFCNTDLGRGYCTDGHIRHFFVQESESLGPAVARYFASKLWHGETFFMQIDAHSLFVEEWDSSLVKDITSTPSYPYSVLSHYPPDTKADYKHQPGYRICGAIFAESKVEYQIIRFTSGMPVDSSIRDKPCPAPFVGAGFFFAHASFLAEIPFDPYVPWVFMGEELLLSLRFWTWGFDIYSPTRNVLSHFYVRRHTPKFWETVNRVFRKPSMHNDLTNMIIHRVKHIAGYPESSTEVLKATTPSLLAELDLYRDGDVRAMEDYMDLVGLDMVSKRAKKIDWCFKCGAPHPV